MSDKNQAHYCRYGICNAGDKHAPGCSEYTALERAVATNPNRKPQSMDKHTQPAPGPWRPSHWGGGDGFRKGYYVERSLGGGSIDWMKHKNGRCMRFETCKAALAAIASKATEGAQE